VQVDEMIDFLCTVEDGWWKGRLNGRVGVFPSNFVEATRHHAAFVCNGMSCQIITCFSPFSVRIRTLSFGLHDRDPKLLISGPVPDPPFFTPN